MEDADAQRQIDQMVAFIINEAKDKAAEIEAKSQEDFNVEKLKALQSMKEKIRQNYRKKAKDLETNRAIAQSAAINKARLKKIAARQMKINDAVKTASKSLQELGKDQSKYSRLCCELIVQCMLRLMEPHVLVRIRKQDENVVTNDILKAAQQKYSAILENAGIKGQTVKAELDKEFYLPPAPASNADDASAAASCTGGVVVTSADRKIKCDNTFDSRLQLVVQQKLPEIRKVLYEN
ncbi:putative vacuolar ATP synthase subunit E [Gregarina niphandrodes]|uniref:Vacuolar ATP synthase subunit E n=1 Tax=Gregarina niphandrodes TaxID=110365 RepID=A0A023AYU0_GRENI|nr:putative vacuolar ATP synthase subunit E [Gregarina niphandrodes]EZG43831.1 putative vacuolar ATP synthase subunit E [Gregarina niphandrodes]|eukprot:XP_011132986.1 putative vacuolar ATP synthase subunit E [Gregarina niphandrodes]